MISFRSFAGLEDTISNGLLEILLLVCWIVDMDENLDRLNNSAGITVGAVVVPQSMAYATLAQLPPQFGLYSSFMGVLIYWFFATSKDITIGVSFVRQSC
jgi:MFS superfamily sulfate permease-like transporter